MLIMREKSGEVLIIILIFILQFKRADDDWRGNREERHECGRDDGGIYNLCDAQRGHGSVYVCVCVLFIVLIGVISSEQPTAVSESHAAMQHVNHQHASWPTPNTHRAVTLCVCV